MQNIKANGDKFLVEMKNDKGEYEPLGVLSFDKAVEMQFTTHRTIRMQRVSPLEAESSDASDNGDDAIVGHQHFTRGELRDAVAVLADKVKAGMGTDEKLDQYDIRNGYSITEGRDPSENEWPTCMGVNFEDVYKCLAMVKAPITRGDLEVYFNDTANYAAFPVNHGILITDGTISKIY